MTSPDLAPNERGSCVVGNATRYVGATLGHNVGSAGEVDHVMAAAAKATFWGGYAVYFQDPDGHLWEVVWNAAWAPTPPAS